MAKGWNKKSNLVGFNDFQIKKPKNVQNNTIKPTGLGFIVKIRVFSNPDPCKDENSRFRTVPLKTLSELKT